MDKGCDITPCSDSTASRSLECRGCIRSSGERDPVVWKRGKKYGCDSVDSRELLGTSTVWRRADVIEILNRGEYISSDGICFTFFCCSVVFLLIQR